MFRISIFTFILLWSGSSNACVWAEGTSHAEYRACLQQAAELSLKEVDMAEKQLSQRIADADEEGAYKKNGQALLRESAASYRNYRSAHCDFEAGTAAGGNGAQDLRLQCQVDLDKGRIGQLRTHHGILISH
jgi:uncharacterized protein YecT (DUF1311 family)